jgi:hypothetical protein
MTKSVVRSAYDVATYSNIHLSNRANIQKITNFVNPLVLELPEI